MEMLYSFGLACRSTREDQERGIFRTEYAGSTLREHYGLPRPESIYSDATGQADAVATA